MELFDLLSADDIYAWILVNMSGDKRGVLLAESGYDCLVFDAHLCPEEMLSIACGGKETVLETMQIVESEHISSVCAVVDADVDSVLEVALPLSVYTTDMGDLDAEAFFSSEGGATYVIPLLPPGVHSSREVSGVLDEVVALAFAIGTLRLTSVRDGLNLSLADLPLGTVMFQTPDVFADFDSLGNIAVRRSVSPSICAVCASRILKGAAQVDPAARDVRLCNGHDLAAALGIAIKRLNGPAFSGKTLEALLKALLHRCSLFVQLGFYEGLKGWGMARGIQVWHEACDVA